MRLRSTPTFNKVPRAVNMPGIRHRVSLCFALAALLIAPIGRGQQASVKALPTSSTGTRAPLAHVYMNFLLYQNHLDKSAAVHEQQGKDGSWLRDHFQRQLGFTDSQFAIVRATGTRLQLELADVQHRAKTIVLEDRIAHPRLPKSHEPLPPPNPQLRLLTQERESIIQREMANLNTQLDSRSATKLKTFLENDFLRGANEINLHPGPHHEKFHAKNSSQTVQP
jgi:hypothetical protein